MNRWMMVVYFVLFQMALGKSKPPSELVEGTAYFTDSSLCWGVRVIKIAPVEKVGDWKRKKGEVFFLVGPQGREEYPDVLGLYRQVWYRVVSHCGGTDVSRAWIREEPRVEKALETHLGFFSDPPVREYRVDREGNFTDTIGFLSPAEKGIPKNFRRVIVQTLFLNGIEVLVNRIEYRPWDGKITITPTSYRHFVKP